MVMLAVYRIGIAVPTPGIDTAAMKDFFRSGEPDHVRLRQSDVRWSARALLDLRARYHALHQRLDHSAAVDRRRAAARASLERGRLGRRKITQYTRYGTVLLAFIQASSSASASRACTTPGGSASVPPGIGFRMMTALTLTCGTIFLMWVGEQISERGIGNGISLIIFAYRPRHALGAVCNHTSTSPTVICRS
jgi:preprotein translocase subunit SecY